MGEPWYERLGDYVLGIVSPTRAAVRRHWREMSKSPDYVRAYETALRVRGYKSAKSSKNSTPWLDASNRSADAEILSDLPALRARSRALNRDNPIASGITGTLVRGVVGTGLRPQARTGSDAKDDALEAVWRSRCDFLAPADGNLPHGAQQRLRYSKRLEDGEVFRRAAVAAPGEPLWIETVEADRVCTPRDGRPLDPSGRIVDGVEKDGFGRTVAYWILKRHPGEFLNGQTKLGPKADRTSAFAANAFDRVDASTVHHDRAGVSRPGQTRGVPRCHAILQELHDLDLLVFAAIKKSQVSTCLAAFLTSDATATDLIELTAEEYGYQLDQKIEPGMIFRLNPGEEVKFLDPASGLPDLATFIFFLARRVGAAIGLSPQAVLKAWETLSYSAARTVKIEDRKTFHGERADFAAALRWEWLVVLEDELLRGNPLLVEAGVTREDLYRVDWIGDEEQWVDPQAEANAVETMLRLGLTTFQTECARLGRDWQENLREQAAEKALRGSLGLSVPTEPTVSPTQSNLKVVPGNGSQAQGEAAA